MARGCPNVSVALNIQKYKELKNKTGYFAQKGFLKNMRWGRRVFSITQKDTGTMENARSHFNV